ncbi:hypothetical protein RV134_310112 [Roseovarius sp. EC-HK134]|nr:hypothetical protein RV420_360219 [Roseovarius sp. EC-SD190]VVT19610.1 hypothetical protein RV134_310112 [Roseovarius sp. EC-HK134]
MRNWRGRAYPRYPPRWCSPRSAHPIPARPDRPLFHDPVLHPLACLALCSCSGLYLVCIRPVVVVWKNNAVVALWFRRWLGPACIGFGGVFRFLGTIPEGARSLITSRHTGVRVTCPPHLMHCGFDTTHRRRLCNETASYDSTFHRDDFGQRWPSSGHGQDPLGP